VNNDCINAKEVYYSICGAGRSLGFVCAPALFQHMIPSCLGYTADLETYKKNRDILYNALTSYGYTLAKPDGAFYLFMKALGNSALEFSEKAKEYELLLVPSDSFGYEGYIRISYCVSTKQIENSLPAFKKLIDSYNNEE
jgi:aspartate aminotransferase